MPKYHVHVYKVVGLCEVEVTAESPQSAMSMTLRQAKQDDAVWSAPDNQYIAIPFDLDQPSEETTK